MKTAQLAKFTKVENSNDELYNAIRKMTWPELRELCDQFDVDTEGFGPGGEEKGFPNGNRGNLKAVLYKMWGLTKPTREKSEAPTPTAKPAKVKAARKSAAVEEATPTAPATLKPVDTGCDETDAELNQFGSDVWSAKSKAALAKVSDKWGFDVSEGSLLEQKWALLEAMGDENGFTYELETPTPAPAKAKAPAKANEKSTVALQGVALKGLEEWLTPPTAEPLRIQEFNAPVKLDFYGLAYINTSTNAAKTVESVPRNKGKKAALKRLRELEDQCPKGHHLLLVI